MIFSAAAFSQKLGGALAGAMIGYLLASMGYVANQEQTAQSNEGILLLMTIIPGVFAVIAVAIISFYPLSDDKVAQLQQEIFDEDGELGEGTARG